MDRARPKKRPGRPMTETISRETAAGLLAGTNGRFFQVKFIKRGDGSLRQMTCRTGVRKHLRGGQAAYSFSEKSLLPVWEPIPGRDGQESYRSIPLDGITEITVDGRTYTVVQDQ